jgi:FtsH-binding integral membrane protein
MGLGAVVLMATGKIIWSIQNAGESGKSIIIPAILGLIICSGLVFYGNKRLERKNDETPTMASYNDEL